MKTAFHSNEIALPAPGRRLGCFEADLLADRFRQCLQNPRVIGKNLTLIGKNPAVIGKNAAVIGKNPAMLKEQTFDAREAFGADPIRFGNPAVYFGKLSQERRLILNQQRHRLFQATIAPILRSRHGFSLKQVSSARLCRIIPSQPNRL
jgi:hypothetical protein